MLTRAFLYPACAVLFVLNVAQADSPKGLIKLGADALISISSTGKTLAAWSPAHPESVRFVVTETGKRGATLPLEPETDLLFLEIRRKDGYLSAVTSDGRLLTWTGGSRCLGILSLPSPATEVTFFGDKGSMLIDLVDGDRYLAVGPVLFPPSSVATLRYRDWGAHARRQLNHVDFSPDGKLLAVALDDGLSIVNADTGKEQEFYPHGCFVAGFGSSSDKVFCVGSRQHGMADLRRRTFVPMDSFGDATRRLTGARLMTKFSWEDRGVLAEADTGRVVNYFKADLIDRPMQSGVSDNGKFFMLVGRGRDQNKMHLEIFGVRGQPVNATAMHVNEAAGRLLLAEYSRVSVWDLQSGKLIWMGDVDEGKVASAALSPDGRGIAIGKESGEVHIQRIQE